MHSKNVLSPRLSTRRNAWFIGPAELVQHFAYRRSSHRRNGAISNRIYMVWLYRSPFSLGRKGAFYLSSICRPVPAVPAFAAPKGRGVYNKLPPLKVRPFILSSLPFSILSDKIPTLCHLWWCCTWCQRCWLWSWHHVPANITFPVPFFNSDLWIPCAICDVVHDARDVSGGVEIMYQQV